MGLRLAARANGVAKLHGVVSREMFQRRCGPALPVDEVPIGSITNGVHAPHLGVAGVDALLAASVGVDWAGADAGRGPRCATSTRPRHGAR